MARLQIIYDVSDDAEEIIKTVEDHVNMNTSDEGAVFELIQKKMQTAFDEGRKFQKQISTQTAYKDSLLYKADI